MLGPADRIADRRCLIGPRCPNECVRYLVEEDRGDAANLFHHFWRVAREVAAQRLQDAARMLQGGIPLRKTELVFSFVEPGFVVVRSFLRIPAGEKTI